MIAFGKDFARASCVVDGEKDETSIDILYQKEGKIIKVDGVKLSRSIDLLEHVYIVVFSPEDLKIIKEGIQRAFFQNLNNRLKISLG